MEDQFRGDFHRLVLAQVAQYNFLPSIFLLDGVNDFLNGGYLFIVNCLNHISHQYAGIVRDPLLTLVRAANSSRPAGLATAATSRSVMASPADAHPYRSCARIG